MIIDYLSKYGKLKKIAETRILTNKELRMLKGLHSWCENHAQKYVPIVSV